MSNFEPRNLQCVECGATFEFSVEDQEFYSERGYSEPRRCPQCRQARKARGGNGGGRGGDRRPQQRQSYTVICSACGCETSVPFQPKDDRPVFCSECYKKQQRY